MRDTHIHIEDLPYNMDTVEEYAGAAASMGLEEIWLLEHSYRFCEFAQAYSGVRRFNEHQARWAEKRVGTRPLAGFLKMMEEASRRQFPVKVLFGLECCYLEEHEDLIRSAALGRGFDFLLGSVHHIDGFAYDFDWSVGVWEKCDVDAVVRRYFEISERLVKSGIFDGIAHPDCFKLYGFLPSFDLVPSYVSLAKLLYSAGMFAENNSGVFRRERLPGGRFCGDLGLDPAFLKVLVSEGVTVNTASDAHSPKDVGKFIGELARDIAAV